MARIDDNLLLDTADKARKGDARAFAKLTEWAEGGDVAAMVGVAMLYDVFDNPAITTDLEKARFWYKEAAERGDRFAQMSFANMCHYREGGSQDLEEAFRWYKAAAEQGEKESQMHVARFYQTGQVVEKDLDTAIFWYKKAIANGHELAATNLGSILMKSDDRENNYEEAFGLFRFAAEKGDGIAHFHLGEMNVYGQGVDKNVGRALLHYFIAESLCPDGHNRDIAKEKKDHILDQNPEVREEFEKRADDYLKGKGFRRPQ